MFKKKQGPETENNEVSSNLNFGNKLTNFFKSAYNKTAKACNNAYIRLRHRGHEESYYYNSDGTAKFDINRTLETKKRKFHMNQNLLALLVLIPAFIFIIVFMIYPIINSFIIAFTEDFTWVDGSGSFAISNIINGNSGHWEDMSAVGGDGMVWVEGKYPTSFGLGNFFYLFQDTTYSINLFGQNIGTSLFIKSLWNTFELVIIEVPLTIIVSLLIAYFIHKIKFLRGFFQIIFFLPYVTNTIALGMVFNLLFGSNTSGAIGGGLVNTLLNSNQQWISSGAPRWAQGVVIVTYALWDGLAFKILVFLSGLSTIDKQYYDAARIDGANATTIFRRITVPLLSPQILYITITSFIGAFKMYTGVRAVYQSQSTYYFGGVQGVEWITVVGYLYRDMKEVNPLNPGYAAAGSIVLLIIILLITMAQFAVSKKRVHY